MEVAAGRSPYGDGVRSALLSEGLSGVRWPFRNRDVWSTAKKRTEVVRMADAVEKPQGTDDCESAAAAGEPASLERLIGVVLAALPDV